MMAAMTMVIVVMIGISIAIRRVVIAVVPVAPHYRGYWCYCVIAIIPNVGEVESCSRAVC